MLDAIRKVALAIAAFLFGCALNLSGIQIQWLAIPAFLLSGVLAILAITGWFRNKQKKQRLTLRAVLSLVLVLIVGISISATLSKESIPIHPAFVPIHRAHPELGRALAEAQSQRFVYYSVHEHAIVIWFDEPLSGFYRLAGDQWTFRDDRDVDTNPNWGNDAWLRAKFNTPDGKFPPYSGVAKKWDRDSQEWSWIGWRLWHCDYVDASIHYQKFQHGAVVGGFLRNVGHPDELVYAFVGSGDGPGPCYSEIVAAGKIGLPTCSDPEERRWRTNSPQ